MSSNKINRDFKVKKGLNVATHITASGNISASIISTGSFGNLSIDKIPNVSASLAAALAGGDNLGNHTATQDLNLNNNNIINVTNLTSTSTGSFGRIEATGSAESSFLQESITTALASSVGAITDGTTISAGTSIESLLRQILIDFIPATLNTFTVSGLDTRLEIMDTDSVSGGTFDASPDSLGNGFSDFTVALTGNTNASGIADNTLSSFSANIAGESFSFNAKTIQRTTPGTVTFTPTATFSDGAGGTSTDSLPTDTALVFAPLFVGASSRGSSLTNGGGLDTEDLDGILGHISGSVSEDATYLHNRNLTSFGTQCYLGNNSVPLTTSNQLSLFKDLNINPPSDAATTGNYLYIVYPEIFGDLTKLELSGVGDLLGGGDVFKVGDADHTRENTAVSYRVYRSNLAGAFSDSQTLTISATG